MQQLLDIGNYQKFRGSFFKQNEYKNKFVSIAQYESYFGARKIRQKNADFYMPTGCYIGKFVRFYHDKFMQIDKTDNNDEREKWQNLIIPCQIYAI